MKVCVSGRKENKASMKFKRVKKIMSLLIIISKIIIHNGMTMQFRTEIHSQAYTPFSESSIK